MTVIWKGPNFEDAAIVMKGGDGIVANVLMVPVIPYDEGDEITIEGSVDVYDDEVISVREGETEVGTIQNIGVFKREFIAEGAGEFSLSSEARHEYGFLMVSKA